MQCFINFFYKHADLGIIYLQVLYFFLLIHVSISRDILIMQKDSREQQKGDETVVSTENLWYKLYHRLKYDVVQYIHWG